MGSPQYKATVQLLVMSIVVAYITHLSACLWVLVGRIGDKQRALNDDREFDDWRGKYMWHGSAYTGYYTNWLQAQG